MLTGPDAASPAGVVLAAGLGTRLRPLTTLRPKPLCPVGNVAPLDAALAMLASYIGEGVESVAVNTHYLAEQIIEHVGRRATLSREQELLGTAGALGALSDWRAGRDVVLVNADAYLARPGEEATVLGPLLQGWDGERVRMLVVPVAAEEADFPASTAPPTEAQYGWRYVGACLLPARDLAPLTARPSGLFSTVWQPARTAGRLEFVEHHGIAIDTGTPAGYLAANLHASGGRSVVGPGAVVAGRLTRSVVWPGAAVQPDEELVEAIRAGTPMSPITVRARARTAT